MNMMRFGKVLAVVSLIVLVSVLFIRTSSMAERVRRFIISTGTSLGGPQTGETNNEMVQDTSQPPATQHKISLTPTTANASPSGSTHWNESKLTPEVIKGIKKFVFFIGYPRSGHSIVGTLLDAHPHVVTADQFCLFNKIYYQKNLNRETLFQSLYEDSVMDEQIRRASTKKGYSLKVDGLWQGKFADHIEVIGDTCGGMTTNAYTNHQQLFRMTYKNLIQALDISVRVIHVLRNPFDMVSTDRIVLKWGGREDIDKGKKLLRELKRSESNKVTITTSALNLKVKNLFKQFDSIVEMKNTIFRKDQVLEIHNSDLVADPRGTMLKIFHFLEVDITEHYLDVCAEKVFKSVSRSRDLMVWPPEQREWVEKEMKKYEMLSRYNFTSD